MGVIVVAVVVAAAFGIATNGGDDVARNVVDAQSGPPQSGAPASTPVGQPIAPAFGLAFPALASQGRWRPVGRRVDQVDGRTVVTVVYGAGGRRLAYSVVDGAPVGAPQGARRVDGATPAVLAFDAGGRTAVMVTRDGHSVVLSAAGVPRSALVRAARTMPPDG